MLAERARSTVLRGVCQLMSCVDRAGALAERARSTALRGAAERLRGARRVRGARAARSKPHVAEGRPAVGGWDVQGGRGEEEGGHVQLERQQLPQLDRSVGRREAGREGRSEAGQR